MLLGVMWAASVLRVTTNTGTLEQKWAMIHTPQGNTNEWEASPKEETWRPGWTQRRQSTFLRAAGRACAFRNCLLLWFLCFQIWLAGRLCKAWLPHSYIWMIHSILWVGKSWVTQPGWQKGKPLSVMVEEAASVSLSPSTSASLQGGAVFKHVGYDEVTCTALPVCTPSATLHATNMENKGWFK